MALLFVNHFYYIFSFSFCDCLFCLFWNFLFLSWHINPLSHCSISHWHISKVPKYFCLKSFKNIQLLNSIFHIFPYSPVETDAEESLSSAWQTTHQCTYNTPLTFVFIHTIKYRHFFGVTHGCFRPWGRSDKCITDLVKCHFVFLAVLGFVQVNKSNTG